MYKDTICSKSTLTQIVCHYKLQIRSFLHFFFLFYMFICSTLLIVLCLMIYFIYVRIIILKVINEVISKSGQ